MTVMTWVYLGFQDEFGDAGGAVEHENTRKFNNFCLSFTLMTLFSTCSVMNVVQVW